MYSVHCTSRQPSIRCSEESASFQCTDMFPASHVLQVVLLHHHWLKRAETRPAARREYRAGCLSAASRFIYCRCAHSLRGLTWSQTCTSPWLLPAARGSLRTDLVNGSFLAGLQRAVAGDIPGYKQSCPRHLQPISGCPTTMPTPGQPVPPEPSHNCSIPPGSSPGLQPAALC